ncbi:unnamed protein product [Caenorhabditis angaria]|uniref:Uncharacterized protein n=1 Tax=Caenorhabditis angaria TaxID=860376 RepID=A0A9P1ICD1_9PELO|nr:unnamed protein product [Caenorhabditis angaria]
MTLLILLTTLHLAFANHATLIEHPLYAVDLFLHCSIKQDWGIKLFFTNGLDNLRVQHENHTILGSNWFNKSYILEKKPTVGDISQVDIRHTCNDEDKGPWRKVRRNLNEDYTDLRNLGTWIRKGYVDPHLRPLPVDFSLKCDVKLDWTVEISYKNDFDVGNSRRETIEVENSHQFNFTRSFNKNPTHIGFTHNCTSNPNKDTLVVEKTEFKRYFDLTDRGV